jgi:ParB-like chromosome segregation protein Spo0J
MKTYNPLHAPVDKTKLASIIEAIRTNQAISPIVVSGEQAITGSHRIRAFEIAFEKYSNQEAGWEDTGEPSIPVVEIDDETLLAACNAVGADDFSEVVHYDDLYVEIERLTTDEELKAAVADQY